MLVNFFLFTFSLNILFTHHRLTAHLFFFLLGDVSCVSLKYLSDLLLLELPKHIERKWRGKRKFLGTIQMLSITSNKTVVNLFFGDRRLLHQSNAFTKKLLKKLQSSMQKCFFLFIKYFEEVLKNLILDHCYPLTLHNQEKGLFQFKVLKWKCWSLISFLGIIKIVLSLNRQSRSILLKEIGLSFCDRKILEYLNTSNVNDEIRIFDYEIRSNLNINLRVLYWEVLRPLNFDY